MVAPVDLTVVDPVAAMIGTIVGLTVGALVGSCSSSAAPVAPIALLSDPGVLSFPSEWFE